MMQDHGYGRWTDAIKTLVCIALFLTFFSATSAQAEIISPPADTIPVAAETPPVPAPAPASTKDESLVLQIVINSEEMAEFIEGLRRKDKTYLPLHQLSTLLDFPIKVDAAKKTAEGWFIKEDRKLSISETKATVRGDSYDLSPDSVISQGDDLFIDTDLLQKWFPITFATDLQNMVISLTTRESLPFQESKWRQKLHAKLEQSKLQTEKEPEYKMLQQEYDAAQWPSIDITYSPAYDSRTERLTQNYSVLASGDFGYLTTKLYASGDLSDEALSDLRLTLGRDDYEHKLLGPLRASSFSVGDINSVSLEQTTSSGTGRGATVTNRALDRPDQFDVTSFIGDSKPGWDVELYRNDSLIAYQTVGTNGRYEFLNIPIFFGQNVFRLAFYGPQGQRDEIIKTYDADSSLLEKGQFTYDISVDQKGKSLFGIGDTSTSNSLPGSSLNEDIPRMIGAFEYGVTRWLTATAGSAYTTVDNKHHSYVTGGLHASLAGMLLAVDHAYDTTDGAYSTQFSASTHRFGTDIQVKQKIADNFVSEAENEGITSQTDLALNRDLTLPLIGMFGNNLQLTRKNFDTGRREELVSHTLSKSLPFLGMSLSHTFTLDHDNAGLLTKQGTLTLHGSYKKLQLEGQMEYDLDPSSEIRRTKLTALYPITDRIANNTILTDTRGDDHVTELENTITFDMQKYKLSLTGKVDTDHEFYIGASVNTAIGKVPGTKQFVMSSQSLAATGTVAVRPFIDRNYNQTYDKGEEISVGGGVRIGDQSPKINDKGYVVATQLAVNLPVAIKLDPLVDPFALDQTSNPNLIGVNYKVVPRPGKVITLDFPMFETSQIDGMVHVPEGFDPGGLQVEAVTSEGQVVASVFTSFDGYFLIEGLMPGTYKLRVNDAKLAAAHIARLDDRTLTIKISDLYTQDIQMGENYEALLDSLYPPFAVPN